METIIIQPKDEAELNFFVELAKRLGVEIKTYENLADEQLLNRMEENRNTGFTNKKTVIGTLQNILNEGQASYNED